MIREDTSAKTPRINHSAPGTFLSFPEKRFSRIIWILVWKQNQFSGPAREVSLLQVMQEDLACQRLGTLHIFIISISWDQEVVLVCTVWRHAVWSPNLEVQGGKQKDSEIKFGMHRTSKSRDWDLFTQFLCSYEVNYVTLGLVAIRKSWVILRHEKKKD